MGNHLISQSCCNRQVIHINRHGECPICIEEFKHGDTLMIMSCSHIYHIKCIREWNINNNTCPMCRNLFDLKREHSVGMASVA